jgi:hypothetical protein
MREQSEAWLAAKGVDQYQDQQFAAKARHDIEALIERQRFAVLSSDGHDTLALAALVEPDLDLWTPADHPDRAWYIARVMVATHGQRHGALLLDLIALAAAMDGRDWLRLDCWRTNYALDCQYESCGFDHVRTVNAPNRLSGALFQRATDAALPEPWDAPAALLLSDLPGLPPAAIQGRTAASVDWQRPCWAFRPNRRQSRMGVTMTRHPSHQVSTTPLSWRAGPARAIAWERKPHSSHPCYH